MKPAAFRKQRAYTDKYFETTTRPLARSMTLESY